MHIEQPLMVLGIQRAAREMSRITGGTLDCLLHNAARMERDSVMKGFDDLYALSEGAMHDMSDL